MAISQTARNLLRVIPLLLLLLAVVFIRQSAAPPDAREGLSLWAVRDHTPPPESLSAFATYARKSLSVAFARSQQIDQPPLYYLLLDAWTLLAGGSLLAARLPSFLFVVLLAAIAYRIAGQMMGLRASWLVLGLIIASPLLLVFGLDAVPQASLTLVLLTACAVVGVYALGRFIPNRMRSRYVLISAGLIVISAALQLTALQFLPDHQRADWSVPVTWMQAERQASELAVTDIDPRSPLAFYLPQLQRGITLDLGWQPQTPATMLHYAEVLDGVPVIWAVLPESDEASKTLLDQLQIGYTISAAQQAGDMIFYRLERTS